MTDVGAPLLTKKKQVRYAGAMLDVVEPKQIDPVSCEVITEFRLINNIVAVSFATLVVDGDDPSLAEARICVRLRITLETLSDLQRGINAMIADAAKAKETAN